MGRVPWAAAAFGVALLVIGGSAFAPAPGAPGALLLETFEDGMGSWVMATDAKYNGLMKLTKTAIGDVDDTGLEATAAARHYGIAVPLPAPADPGAQKFVFQYEVTLKEGIECGGAYVKLLTATDSLNLAELDGDTPYTIMFGPDKCGGTNKVHLILRHKNPLTGDIEEKHLQKTPYAKTDKLPHLYTLVLEPNDNTFQILVDNEVAEEGSLFTHFKPPFNPPAEIDDPTDKKPEDWVDDAKMEDPDAAKPDDWDEDAPLEIDDLEAEMPEGWLVDEPLEVDDPEAEAPEDWDPDEDGEWEAPKVENPRCDEAPGCGEWTRPKKHNPDYKGPWYAPMVDNPAYKGVWKPKQIPNPDHYNDENPLSSVGKVGAVAVEIWTMSSGVTFDNFLIATKDEVADDYAEATWRHKFDVENSKPKEEEDAAPEVSLGAKMEGIVRDVINSGPMAALKPTIEPLVDAAIEKVGSFPVALAVILSPWVLVAVILSMCCGGKSTPDAAASAKKTDAPTQDDAADTKEKEAEEDEDEDEKPKETLPKKRTTRSQRAN